MTRALAGDRRAEEAIFRRHVRHIGRVIARLSRGRIGVEACVLDTFAAALGRLRTADRAGLRHWIARIAQGQVRRRARWWRRPHAASGAPGRLDDLAVRRIWRALEAQRAAPRRPRVHGGRAALVAGAVAAVLVLLAIALWPRDRFIVVTPASGPLALADGRELPFMAGSMTFRLQDDSSITIRGGAGVEPVENSATALVLIQRGGRVTYDVRPGPVRRWSIESGLATVEAVGGTRFVIESSRSRLRVTVDHGIALVRGERVEDRVQRVLEGQSLDVVDVVDAGAP